MDTVMQTLMAIGFYGGFVLLACLVILTACRVWTDPPGSVEAIFLGSIAVYFGFSVLFLLMSGVSLAVHWNLFWQAH